jgi:argininosuccinate lyase
LSYNCRVAQNAVHLQNFSLIMKLWQKGFDISKEIETFTVGRDRELDVWLAPHDVLGSIAHITMLESIGLLNAEELKILKNELQLIYNHAQQGNFTIEDGVEDVHSQVELLLTRSLGETGKKIHSGRSRNDQVLLDLKLYIRHEIVDVVNHVKALFDLLLAQSERYKHVLMPGYTHYQVAMPSSFGLWFAAYAESLIDDLLMLQAAYRVANKNPLGSAAGYGSSFPLNRQLTTDLLGFDSLNYNVVYAQMGRGKTERIVAEAMAGIAATLGKLSQDICLYISQNFNFVSFPPELTTGSSIMPHKKNPDVFELIRARSNKMMALPNEIALITTNLASGYHRDLQLIKESFLPVFGEIKSCLSIAHYALQHIIINESAVNDDKYRYMFSVEVVNDLVLQGYSFRDAYRKVGEDIAQNNFEPNYALKHTHEGSIGNLCNDHIAQQMQQVLNSFQFERVQQALNQLLQTAV